MPGRTEADCYIIYRKLAAALQVKLTGQCAMYDSHVVQQTCTAKQCFNSLFIGTRFTAASYCYHSHVI